MIFAHQNLISNWLIYLSCARIAKSTGELIGFVFSDCSVRSLDSANRSALRWVQTKNDFTFWLIVGLSPNLGLNESLSKRPIQNVQRPSDCHCILGHACLHVSSCRQKAISQRHISRQLLVSIPSQFNHCHCPERTPSATPARFINQYK